MNLDCINDIIKDNLAIHLDLTNNKSWIDYNTDLTTISLSKWNKATSDNIKLFDYGLTAFDNGHTKIMWSGITLTPSDILFKMYPVGYNEIKNPTTGETSGITINTVYLPINPITSLGTNNYYFDLLGGYLQGFFKLKDYDYTLLSSRYNSGITIETIVYLHEESYGIFYMMGARAEDKYNSYFSGETITGNTIVNGISTIAVTGVTTSENNYLDALMSSEIHKKNFIYPENNKETVYSQETAINNLKYNVIAFELTEDKHLGYRYIDGNGQVITNHSTSIVSTTGFTMIDIVFKPNEIILDETILDCSKRRLGKLIFYINGRSVWTIVDFPEFYFFGFSNDKEKQIGVPYSISWGGGSFGLKNSWHYDYQTYIMYNGQDSTYINDNFIVRENPLSGSTLLSGLSISANSASFDNTVMRVDFTGGTNNCYYLMYSIPISAISNRDYTVNVSIFDDGFLKNVDDTGKQVNNKISIIPIGGTTDISIVDDIEYIYPVINGSTIQNSIITGQNDWKNLNCIFRTDENSGQNFINIGILIETSYEFNPNSPLYIKNFTYTASDILVQDSRKNNLLIEQNFDIPFNGGIQKLRIYDNELSAAEILHNALIESQTKPDILVSKGGRIIYR